ncbi:coproporphyrinogen III oxidase, partial [Tremellales sp. Uapishka_1]
MRIRMATWVTNLQDHIVNTLETFEPHKKFKRDHWIRPEGGEGSSCVLAGGETFEKAGVNVSVVHGLLPPAAQAQMRAEHASIPISSTPLPFFATGVSIVLHPQSPHIPTVHLNYRYFELHNPGDDPSTTPPIAWWFGGGSDLTPNYLVEADATHFHQTLKDACDRHHGSYWQTYKKWCDKYFYIPHRKESRGVGGLFFDDLTTASEIHADRPKSQEEIFSFVKDISGAFLPAYIPIVEKNRRQPWTEAERSWQLLRRGRYVEFNLVYDRGTKFGLMTPGARIESILMRYVSEPVESSLSIFLTIKSSLPDTARWEYMSEIGTAGSGTEEEKLVEVLKNPKEWV